MGMVKGTRNDITADIIVSSRQTLQWPGRREQIRGVGLIIVDECHHALRHNTYGKILEYFGAFEAQPRVRVAGFTATLARGDDGKLSTVWEEVTFRRDILFGIRHGYLLDVRGHRVEVEGFDMNRVRQSAGDYRDTDLAEELERTYAPEVVAKAYKDVAAGRKGIAFWPLVDVAYHGAEAFNAEGITSEVIHGKLPKEERRAVLRRLHTGETQVVHGVGVLTEGFDEPTVDVVVIARPTRSGPLYQQMVGRVLRPDLTIPWEQREKALILDVVGASGKHDLRSLVDLAPERMQGVSPMDGDSLLELDEMIEELQEPTGGGFEFEGAEDYRGPVKVEAFDPLGRDRRWQQTPAGTWYMGAGGKAYVFLVESLTGDPGTYDVVTCSAPTWPPSPEWASGTKHVELPFDMAINWAEGVAEEMGGWGHKTLTGRKSAWRKKEPSEKLLRKAAVHRISVVPGWDAGQVADAIDTKLAANRIDPLVAVVTKGAE
jgi:hypothetical protein